MTPQHPRAAELADIDATIAYWRRRGITAEAIGGQLHCSKRWCDIRRRMVAIAMGVHRIAIPSADIVSLAAARRAQGVRQVDIAARLGVSRSAIRDYEHGTRRPAATTLAAWRATLGGAAPARLAA